MNARRWLPLITCLTLAALVCHVFVSSALVSAAEPPTATATAPSDAPPPTLRIVRNDDGAIVGVQTAGLPASFSSWANEPAEVWQRRFFVTTAVPIASDAKPLPPMVGAYSLQGDVATFTPKFAFRSGMKYRATYVQGEQPTTIDFEIPAPPPSEPTKVVEVYPSAQELPENQLRFYLQFSAPMSRGEVYDRVQLLDDAGRALELPFLEIGEELWDASGQRLTLLMDPGRIKKGVKPRDELGTSLKAGETYTLTIDASWPDAEGRPLVESFEKTFKVAPPVEKALDAGDWKLTAPAIGSRDPLTLTFPRPLDHALLQRTLHVFDAAGAPVPGAATIAEFERRWEFTPDAPWATGAHTIVADAVLEDLAGNRVGVPFEQISKPREGAATDDSTFDPAVAKPTRLSFVPTAAKTP